MAEALHDPETEKRKQEDHIWSVSLIVNQAYASSFACVKCKGIPKLCMSNDDGDIFCNKCAENVDNAAIIKAVQKIVNKLKTKCRTLLQDPNYVTQNNNDEAEGVNLIATQISNQSQCNWIGKIEDYDAHSKECQFIIVNCEECKTFECQRKLLDKHMSECPEVKINCALSCGVLILRKNKTNHLENECMEQILTCTNDDCKEQLKRKNFKNHVENVCDTRIVECEYKKFGCNVENIKANQLNTHMNNYKFEHLSAKFDTVTNQLSAKITEQSMVMTRQQQTIDDLKSQLEFEEKGNGMNKLKKSVETMIVHTIERLSGMVHNYDARILVNSGWKCVCDKPYSHKTTTNELRALCGKNMDIFVGGYHKDNKNNIILGAFGPSSVLHQFVASSGKAVIPSDVTNKHVYGVYWYHLEGTSFGFASVSTTDTPNADSTSTNGDDRLSWYLDGSGGYRLGNETGLQSNSDYHKIIYVKEK